MITSFKLFESVGVNTKVDELTNIIYDLIIKTIRETKLDKREIEIDILNDSKSWVYIVNNAFFEGSFDKIKKFKLIITRLIERDKGYETNGRYRIEKDDTGIYNIDIYLKYNPPKKIDKSVLSHEIHHIYEFFRKISNNTPFDKTNDTNEIERKTKEIDNTKQKIIGYDFKRMLHSIYLSSKSEISARVQQTYKELKELKTNKTNFKENIFKTNGYMALLEMRYMDHIYEIQKNPVSNMKKIYTLTNFNISSSIELNYIKSLMPLYNLFNKTYKKEINKKTSEKFFKDVEIHIKNRTKIYERKLYKLYDLF